MNKPMEKHFSSATELDEQLAQQVADWLRAAIASKKSAILGVSGGSTPVNFFKLLSQQDLDWNNVTVTLADERWVPPGHADSNHLLVEENLIQNKAADAYLLPVFTGAPSALEGEPFCDELFGRLGRFDVLLLGMGSDGHTASLFPQAQTLQTGLDMNSGRNAIAVDPVTAPHERMSLTLPRLLRSDQVVVHITGEEKKAILDKAMELENVSELPIAAILQQQKVPVTVYWAP